MIIIFAIFYITLQFFFYLHKKKKDEYGTDTLIPNLKGTFNNLNKSHRKYYY